MRRGPATLALASIASAALVLAAVALGAAGSTQLVSEPSGSSKTTFPLKQQMPAISAKGDFVAFVGDVPGEGEFGATGTGVFLRDMGGGITPVDIPHGTSEHGIEFAAGSPSISADGRFLAFASENPDISDEDRDTSTTLAGDTFPLRDIFVYDRSSGATSLVSRANGPKGAGGSEDSNLPSISADGRYVAFESYASNLGPADNSTVPDVFVRDMRSGRVFLASRADGNGPAANAPSADPSISGDGRYVAFDSHGSNLSPADTLHATSVFRYQLLP